MVASWAQGLTCQTARKRSDHVDIWLFTTQGFFSVVTDRDYPTGVLVRARVRADADGLAAAVGGEVIETPGADYRFRLRMAKTTWAEYVAEQAVGIDYNNFKNAVAARQGYDRARACAEVWTVMRALQQP